MYTKGVDNPTIMFRSISVSLLVLLSMCVPAQASKIIDYNEGTYTDTNDGKQTVTLIGPYGTFVAQCDYILAFPHDSGGYGESRVWEGGTSLINLRKYYGYITGNVEYAGCEEFIEETK